MATDLSFLAIGQLGRILRCRQISAVELTEHFPPACVEHRPFRFGVVAGVVEKVQPEVKANFETSLDVLRRFGTIDEVKLPEAPFGTALSTILSAEKASAFEDFVASG